MPYSITLYKVNYIFNLPEINKIYLRKTTLTLLAPIDMTRIKLPLGGECYKHLSS